NISIIVAGGMVAFMGFCALAVDYGVLIADKNRLQRACDAAALAGASRLPDQTSAKDYAILIASRNAVAVQPGNVTFEQDSQIIRVGAVFARDLWFARVIGISSGSVSAYAKARASTMSTPKVVPIGITKETYDAYKNDTEPHALTLPRPVDTLYAKDQFLVFDLRLNSAKSATHMKQQLIGEDFVNVTLGSYQTSLNASEGPVLENFKDALSVIFQRSSQAPWYDTWMGNLTTSDGIRYSEILARTAPPGNPRIMHIIVNPDGGTPTGGGTWNVQVIDFAPVYLEAFKQTTNPVTGATTTSLIVRFLPQNLMTRDAKLGLIE
ncbi:MAG: pilus assembly protein TadG-related protein, partial [Armatimonadota bacterium]|nr:pilus assembly protein TadG-related protein [Armatimonadota bacterium]